VATYAPAPSEAAIREVSLDGTDRVLSRYFAPGQMVMFRMALGAHAPVSDSLLLRFGRDTVALVSMPSGNARPVFTGPHLYGAISPDHRYLALSTPGTFAASYINALVPWIRESNAVTVVDLRSGARRELKLPFRTNLWSDGPAWQADGRSLLLMGSPTGESRMSLYQVSINDGGARRIATLGVNSLRHTIAVAPDGRNALISLEEPVRSDYLEYTLPGAQPSAPRRK
jgi:hypothetical protein